MGRLQDLPVKQKLTMVILLTCSVVLLLACAVLAGYELYDYRRAMARDTTVLADVLAKNTQAALAFEDDAFARDMLYALQAEPYVVAAGLYDENGQLFADYVRTDADVVFPPSPAADGARFEGRHLVLYRPVTLNEERIGTIYVQSELAGMYERLRLFAGIALIVLIGSVMVAFILSSRLQRFISGPILALAGTARAIAERQDFAVRAPQAEGQHEIAVLTTAFNQMLTGIEERENALRTANEALRGEVAERRAAEDRVQSQLARLELLNQITRAVGERQDLASIYSVLIRSLEERLPVEFCCVCKYEPGDSAIVVASLGTASKELAVTMGMQETTRIPIDENGLSRCVRGHLVYEPDVAQVGFAFPQRLASGGLRSMVAAPLLVESRVFGILVAARHAPSSFSSGECEFLRQLSEHVALATHQVQLYQALQQAYEDLRQTQQAVMQQERLRALGQMASGIAHDINNAISPVALYTESLLETEKNLSPRARDYLKTIEHAIDDVAATVARMREFYRQREPQLSLARVKLNELVEQVLNLTRARWSDMPLQRGIVIELEKQLQEPLHQILGVESEIREALINLVFNAVDAMPDGGTLTLRTGELERDWGAGDGWQRNVFVEVTDTGIGMDEDTRRRCLEPFFTTKGERGTGLGLAMVYGFVKRHGADIEIESGGVGKGSTVRISFSVPAAGAGTGASEDLPMRSPGRLRVLIVDDDPLLIKSLGDALETDGHIVTRASGGQAGIEAFRAAIDSGEEIQAVITDLGMPYVDGRKVAVAIKEMSPHTPVILLTGWGQRLASEGEVPEQIDYVMSKPPKLRELREALARFTLGSQDERAVAGKAEGGRG
ncbi:MAG TPA: CHASE sensor domain-containing protein [Candidatus Binatia bacterium]|nr:CHASE sensor domain-containing protein [Candidatus Binatia bacterium]